jgi:hypothetical protein
MKLTLGFLLVLIVLGQAYYPDHMEKQRQQPKRDMQGRRKAQPPAAVPPATEADEFVQAIIGAVFEDFKHVHIDRYETEDGVLTNIDIKVTPPPKNGITFRFDEVTESFIFYLKQVSAIIDFDMDLYYGLVKGHFTLTINKLDIDIIDKKSVTNGKPTDNIDFHLHLNNADIKTQFSAIEDPSQLPPEMQEKLGAMMSSFPATVKLAAGEMLDKSFERRTEEILRDYLNSQSVQRTSEMVKFFVSKFDSYKYLPLVHKT